MAPENQAVFSKIVAGMFMPTIIYYLIVIVYIGRHITFSSAGKHSAVCVDGGCKQGKYRVPGGASAFSYGILYWGLFPEIAAAQFIMSCTDWLILMSQLLFNAWQRKGAPGIGRLEVVIIRPHFRRCARAAAGDPIGLFLFFIEEVFFKGNNTLIHLILDGVTLVYFLVSFVPIVITITLPALVLGKIVIPLPWPVPMNR